MDLCIKVRWPTQKKALDNLRAGRRGRRKHYESGHQVYYCNLCRSYHIGRPRPKKKRNYPYPI